MIFKTVTLTNSQSLSVQNDIRKVFIDMVREHGEAKFIHAILAMGRTVVKAEDIEVALTDLDNTELSCDAT